MPQMYCDCCHKTTAHKVLLKRCDSEKVSLVRSFVSFFATVLQGDHYVKMEKQYYCRGCNHQSIPAPTAISNIKAA
nr:hypothetical protein [Vibrio taketomensis]